MRLGVRPLRSERICVRVLRVCMRRRLVSCSASAEPPAPLGDQWVVNHELCMGRHTAIVAAHKDHSAHGRGEFQADGADGARCEAHGVIDRKTRSHASAGAGDKYGDGAAGVGGIEQADLLA